MRHSEWNECSGRMADRPDRAPKKLESSAMMMQTDNPDEDANVGQAFATTIPEESVQIVRDAVAGTDVTAAAEAVTGALEAAAATASPDEAEPPTRVEAPPTLTAVSLICTKPVGVASATTSRSKSTVPAVMSGKAALVSASR